MRRIHLKFADKANHAVSWSHVALWNSFLDLFVVGGLNICSTSIFTLACFGCVWLEFCVAVAMWCWCIQLCHIAPYLGWWNDGSSNSSKKKLQQVTNPRKLVLFVLCKDLKFAFGTKISSFVQNHSLYSVTAPCIIETQWFNSEQRIEISDIAVELHNSNFGPTKFWALHC